MSDTRKLLIEYTSIIQEERPKLIESITHNDGRMILRNVKLQHADKPNRNSRIYPKSILEKQLDVYQNKILEKRAFGEADHPECLLPQAEILSEDGWKLIKDVKIGEKVITLNTKTNSVEWNVVNEVINQEYTGKMVSIKGQNINTTVTPNHRFVLVDRYGNFVEKTAQEILNHKQFVNSLHMYIPTTAENWNGVSYDKWIIDGVDILKGTLSNKIKYTDPLELDAKSFFGFLGFYLAEGHCTNRLTTKGYTVFISQNEGSKANKFRKLVKDMSSELVWVERPRKNGKGIVFTTTDARLHTFLSVLGDKYTKYIPSDIKNASSDLLQELLNWFLLGDGTSVKSRGTDRKSIFSVSKRLMEDFNEVLLKVGITGIMKIQNPEDRHIEDRVILKENSKDLHRLWLKSSKGVYIDYRFLDVQEVDYSGTVHCVNVDNGTFYCRDNRSSFWSGNSNIINLKNVCQVILDARWKGNEIYGDVEILKTPSGNIIREILLAGCRIGQSSRGLGSVKQLYESDDPELVEVQDDFEFVTLADAVSDESTYGANMILMKESKGSVQVIKYKKTNELIHDLICELSGNCCLKQ